MDDRPEWEGLFVFLVNNKNTHVFARGGGNFDVSAEGRIKTWLMHVLSHAFLLDESFVSE